MAGEKTVQKCYGPKDLIEKLEECPWIRWIKPGRKGFESFEFDGNRLRNEDSVVKSKCQIKVRDIKTGDEFSIEGFCCPSVLKIFFFSEAEERLMQLAGYYMSPKLTGTNTNSYEVSLEVIEGNLNVD